MSLLESRKELSTINHEIFHLLIKRQKLVGFIQEIKSFKDGQGIWAPEREQELFKSYLDEFPDFQVEDDFLFSFMIENHGCKWGKYPEWSLGVHLEKPLQEHIAMTNPILLFMRNEAQWQKLDLKNDYKKIIKGLFYE